MNVASRTAIAALLAAAMIPASARADGAFPGSLAVFTPLDEPDTIIESTNFGLLVTKDGGESWRFVCEEAISALVSQYALGPSPHALYALGTTGLVRSTDEGCTWTHVVSSDTHDVRDVFPDPIDPLHVLMIARPRLQARTTSTATASDSVFESNDGGDTFPVELYRVARPGEVIWSVEIARADPRPTYLTVSTGTTTLIARALPGMPFELFDQSATLGASVARIASVDPEDPDVIYLRVGPEIENGGDRLAISRDGGRTVELAYTLGGKMATFLRRADGALLLGDTATTLISIDGGHAFDHWPEHNVFPPHPRWITERDGATYISADNFADGFAVGVTRDEGSTFTPLLRFDEIDGIMQCGDLPVKCAAPWENIHALFGIGDPVRPPPPPPPPPPPTTGSNDGCACVNARSPIGLMQGCALLVLAALLARRRRRALYAIPIAALAGATSSFAQTYPNLPAEITTPRGVGDVADTSYTITWTDSDRNASSAASVDFYYSSADVPPIHPGTIPDGIDGEEIARGVSALDPLDRIAWDTSSVAPGAYFIWSRAYEPRAMRPMVVINFSAGAVVVAHEGDAPAPAIALVPLENPFFWPPADTLDIRYDAFDPDGSGTVKLEALSRERPGETLELASGLPAGGDETYVWNTVDVPPGEYAIRATITDARGRSFVVHDRVYRVVNHGIEMTAGEEGCSCTSATARTHAASIVVLFAGLFLSRALRKRS